MRDSLEAKMQAIMNARQSGRRSEEVRLLEEALVLAPDNPQLLNARGMAALADEEFEVARHRFTSAATQDPKEPALWMNLATAYRGLGDDANEEIALERALEIERRNIMAQFRMAEIHHRRGDIAKAAQSWSNTVQIAAAMGSEYPQVNEIAARGHAFLAAHHKVLGEAYDKALGTDLANENAGTRRISACVDNILGKRKIYQNQCAGVYFPFLPADEFFDRNLFPWFAELEAKTPAIREEALRLFGSDNPSIRPYVQMEKGSPDTIWTDLDQSLDWSACFLWEYGERLDAVCDLCPETAAALAAVPQSHVPGKAPSAFFSVLKPGAHIPAHTGVTNTRAIIHLPLVVPEKCRFRVGGETREWKVGEALAFDDTIEHEAWNDSDETRIVLIFDVWNPHLTAEECDLLARLMPIEPDAIDFQPL